MIKVTKVILIFILILLLLPNKISISQNYKFPAEITFKLENNHFYINGYKYYFDSNESLKPIIKNGRTFVPVRSIVESIGGDVTWKNKTREVEIRFKDKLILLTIDKNSAFVNQKAKMIDSNPKIKPFIFNSRTYIPLRFIIESLEGEISYNNFEKSISITIDRATKEILDSNGRKVLVPKKIYRIISLYAMTTIILLSLKVQDKIVGNVGGAKVINLNNIKKIFENYDKIPDAGSFKDYNPETIISLKPDIVVTPHYTNIKKLNEANIPTLLLDHETPENLLKTIEILGETLDKKDEANKILDYFNSRKKYIEESLKNKEKKKVYVAGLTILKSYGSDFYQTFMVDIASGESVTKNIKGGKIEISLEDLFRYNPEYILIPPYFLGTKDDLINNKDLKELRAIKERKVYMFPSFLISYDLPSVESILGIFWISQKIHGDILKINLKDEVKFFYNNIFNYNISDAEILEILKEWYEKNNY